MATQDLQYERSKEVCTQCGKSYPEGTRFCPGDGSELMSTMADPLIGMVLPRRYRVLSLLGRGSMSVVYKGTYEPLDQFVAVKMLKSHLVSDPQQAKRFQQEIKTAGSLNHPNIVGILDFGVTDQGVPYLIMEYLEGKSLSEIIEEEERVPVNRGIKIFSQAADALAYAHKEGVIHRDIKPSNIVVVDTEDERDVVKIVDFGIAKIMSPASSQAGGGKGNPLGLTATGEVLGTPLYMSPEQANGRELDGRSDIYALGCVMYHAITGLPPFVGDTAIDTIRLQISGVAMPVDQARPDLYFPERLQSVINKALQKDPRARYQRMEHLRADIDSCARKPDISTSASTLRVSRVTEAIEPEPIVEEAQGFRPGLPMLCVVLAVLIAGAVATWALLTDAGKHEDAKIDLPIANDVQWHQALAGAQAAFAAGRYQDAEKLYTDAIGEAQKFKSPDPRQATTYGSAAEFALADGKLKEAQTDCQRALAIYQQTAPKDPRRAGVLVTMASVLCKMHDLKGAERCANEALGLRKQALGDTHHDVASALQVLAAIVQARGDFNQADQLLMKAKDIVDKSLGGENPQMGSILYDLARVRIKEGKYQEAEELLNVSLGIRQKYLGVEHPAVADTLCTLAGLEFGVRQDASAATMYRNALAIRQKVFGEQTAPVADVYAALARVFDVQKKYTDAENCFRQAEQIREKIWGANNPRLVPSLQALASFLRKHNQPNGAEVYEAQIKQIESAQAAHK